MKIVALTGNTPHCGKTTVALSILENYIGKFIPYNFSFAEQLKSAVHKMYGLNVPWDHFESSKDIPSTKFHGLTPRQVYIAHGEHMKQLHGTDYWSKLLYNQLSFYEAAYNLPDKVGELYNYSIVSDIGFDYELDNLCKYFGKENVGLIQVINRVITQTPDSRQFVEPVDGLWFTAELFNEGDRGYLEMSKLQEVIRFILDEELYTETKPDH